MMNLKHFEFVSMTTELESLEIQLSENASHHERRLHCGIIFSFKERKVRLFNNLDELFVVHFVSWSSVFY